MRVLVTGPRDWPYLEVVVTELEKLLEADPELVVVEGACPTGADQHAYLWASWAKNRGYLVEPERHPASWKKHGKAAGFIRNQEMVDAGADLCLAFRLNRSRGTTDCIERALRADPPIPIRLIDLNIEDYK